MGLVTTLGISTIKLGAVAVDGDAGTSLATLGTTRQDTAEMVQDDPTRTDLYSEENDTPFYSSVKNGDITFNFGLAQPDVDQLIAVFGGTSTGTPKKWSMPSTYIAIEQTVEITPKVGLKFLIPRGQVTAKMGGKFSKTDALVITVSVKVLQPTKSGVAPLYVTNPA